jgi:protein-tyrosine phosphatase
VNLLFICTGNICRSPTAERLIVADAETRNTDVQASSAGTRAVVAHPIHSEAARVLASLGGDPSAFAARQLTPRIASAADLILTMTKELRDVVLGIAPHRLHQTFTLIEAAALVEDWNARSIEELATLRSNLSAKASLDIPDPIGQSPAVFAAVGSSIATALPPILRLCRGT